MGFGLLNRGWSRDALVSRRTRELLDHISEVVLVDVVHRRLMLQILLLLLLLLWWLWLSILIEVGNLGRIEGGFFGDDGLGDLMRKLVELPQILISASISGGVCCVTTTACGCSDSSIISQVCTRLIAFIHPNKHRLFFLFSLPHSGS